MTQQTTQPQRSARIAVAIPCYRVTGHVLKVIAAIPECVSRIYAVDDGCPDGSGALIRGQCTDPRVRVIFSAHNQGVGGATISAYRQALADAADIVVKIDGDGQMDPALLPLFVQPILAGSADYTKGNRFSRRQALRAMPLARLVGNALLSFVAKISCGYWPIMDPTNGYTAIHASVLRLLPLGRIERRYFFETDMLFHLNAIRAVVQDVAMDSVYADEKSNLKIGRALPEFLAKHLVRLARRYCGNYLARGPNAGTAYSLLGALLLGTGSAVGAWHWLAAGAPGQPAIGSGAVVATLLPLLLGLGLIVAFVRHDLGRVPDQPLHPALLAQQQRPDPQAAPSPACQRSPA